MVNGTGFFIKITNYNNKDFYFLVTANHVLTKDTIESDIIIEIKQKVGKIKNSIVTLEKKE